MRKSTFVLVAVHAIVGGLAGKGGGLIEAVLDAGEELTEAKRKALGLDDDAIAGLQASGALREVEVREAEFDEGDSDAAITAKLSAETKRADAAEAKVKELEELLAEATKPVAAPPAGAAQ